MVPGIAVVGVPSQDVPIREYILKEKEIEGVIRVDGDPGEMPLQIIDPYYTYNTETESFAYYFTLEVRDLFKKMLGIDIRI